MCLKIHDICNVQCWTVTDDYVVNDLMCIVQSVLSSS